MSEQDLKFTDSKLKLFYAQLLEHYKKCLEKPNTNVSAIYTEMFSAVQFSLESPFGHLNKLSLAEKQKVYSAFEFLFQSLPLPADARKQATLSSLPRPAFNKQNTKTIYVYQYDRPQYTWIYLNTMTNSCSSCSHHSHSSFPGDGAGSGSHAHSSNKDSKTDYTQLLAVLALLLLASVAAVLVFLALYHMLNEFMDSVERFWYGEGWLRAALLLASSLVFTATSLLLSVTFAALPFAALAVAAGLDPFLIAGIAVGCLTAMGAGLGSYVMGLLHDSIDRSFNEESMDPSDPYRFRLTDADEQRLKGKHIDPIRVKCAMVAIRAEIAKVLGSEDKVPSYLSRGFLGSSSAVQPWLDKVRAIRYGEIDCVTVGDLKFDFTVPSQYEPLYSLAAQAGIAPPQYSPLDDAQPASRPGQTYTPDLNNTAEEGQPASVGASASAYNPGQSQYEPLAPAAQAGLAPPQYRSLYATQTTPQPGQICPPDFNNTAEGQPASVRASAPAYNPRQFASAPPPPPYTEGLGIDSKSP